MKEYQDRTPGVVLDRVSPSSEWPEWTCESEQESLQRRKIANGENEGGKKVPIEPEVS